MKALPATATLTTLAMLAFAANSVLCRLALGDTLIDPASYTTLRVLSGVVALLCISALRAPRPGAGTPRARRPWLAAGALFTYMICFSLAYETLPSGLGALLLFGAVQLTMLGASHLAGTRIKGRSALGAALALLGLASLAWPSGAGAGQPIDGVGATLMTIAGIAWGLYSVLGKGSEDPLRQTRVAFLRALPLCLIASAMLWSRLDITFEGALLAVASGALASGVGYAIWYTALRTLPATPAATVQLSVPVLAALGGAAVLAEPITVPLLIAAAFVLGGLALTLLPQRR